MSLILEALRKSEAERRRGHAPDVAVELAPAPPPGRVNMRRWLWLVLALVSLFALVPVLAIWWLARDTWVPDGPPASAPSAADVSGVAPVTARDMAAPAVVPRAAPPVPMPTVEAPAPAAIDAPPSITPPPRSKAEPVPATPPTPAADLPPAAVGMSGVKLSMHLWNEEPSRRFVVLNGQRMQEGDRNGEIALLEILRDGVVVERDGQRARIDLP